jgi:hypothetical protein
MGYRQQLGGQPMYLPENRKEDCQTEKKKKKKKKNKKKKKKKKRKERKKRKEKCECKITDYYQCVEGT